MANNKINYKEKPQIKLIYMFENFDRKHNDNWYKPYGTNQLIITEDNAVFVCGPNHYSILGLGHNSEVDSPTILPELCDKHIIDIKNGVAHCLVLTANGEVLSFGENYSSQLGYETNDRNVNKPKIIKELKQIKAISCGHLYSIALTQKGEVYAWGHNVYFQIGNNSNKDQLIPIKVEGLNGNKVTDIRCGAYHTVVLTESGQVYVWGGGGDGQCGLGKWECNPYPKRLIIRDADKFDVLFSKIACGSLQTFLLSRNGEIYSFGSNHDNELGYVCDGGVTEPKIINQIIDTDQETNDIKFNDIYSRNSYYTSIAKSTDGFCYVWGKCGQNSYIYPKKTEFNTIEELFLSYYGITINAIDLSNNLNFGLIKLIDNSYNSIKLTNFFTLKSNELFGIQISNKKFVNFYTDISEIASGNFGSVYKAFNKNDNQWSAVKIISIKNNDCKIETIIREINIMNKLQSHCIVEYRTSWLEETQTLPYLQNQLYSYNLYIEMELCWVNLKQLKDKLFKEFHCTQSLCEIQYGYYIMCEIIIELIEGINYLHRNDVIHRDLKPENILIKDVRNGKFVKIGDLGLSRDTNNCESMSRVGTPKYMAPEIKQNSNRVSGRAVYTNKVDMYSLGVIIEELFDYKLNESYDSVYNFKEEIRKLIEIKCNLLSLDSNTRPNCEQILKEKEKWSLSFNRLNFTELTQMLINTPEKSMDKSFHLFYLAEKLKHVCNI